jgi:prepilin-type N-terminal cleavage/methylation domain-containing protein
MKRANGFTLVEAMTVLAILVILASIAAPSFRSTIERTKVRKTSDLISQLVIFARNEALNKNHDAYLSIQDGASPAFCLSTTTATATGHACDIRRELITAGITVTPSSSGGVIAEMKFSRIFGTPSPIVTTFTVTNGSSTQTVTVNMLGMVKVGAQS